LGVSDITTEEKKRHITKINEQLKSSPFLIIAKPLILEIFMRYSIE